MNNPIDTGRPEHRRAIRMAWDRPADIIEPSSISARVVNISAAGVLLTTTKECNLSVGSNIAVAIPRETSDPITLRGRIVRVENAAQGLNLAVNLMV